MKRGGTETMLATSPPSSSLVQVSPSRIGDFRDCQRKWAWAKIDKIFAPPHPSAQLGTKVHGVLEEYLVGKGVTHDPADPSVGYIAQSGIHLLPEPNAPGLEIETKFSFTPSGIQGVVYTGRIDFLVSPGFGPDGIPLIGDHKTTSDFKWAKRADDLYTDPQGVIYGAYAFHAFPNAAHVDLRWVYYATKKPYKAQAVQARWTREDNERALEKINLTAAEIAARTLDTKTALDLEPNPSACEKFGGCAYRGRCNLGPSARAQSIFPISTKKVGDKTMGFMDKLREKNKTRPSSVEAADVVEAETMNAAPYTVPDKAPNGLPVPPKVKASGLIKYEGAYVELAGLDVFTREAALDNAALEYSRIESPINPPEGDAPPAAPAQPAPAADMVFEDVEKPKRTRRTKAQMEADAAAASKPVELSKAETEVANAKEETEATAPKLQLFINCRPMSLPLLHFADVVCKANERIEESEGVADYALIDFGKGAGLLRVVCVQILQEHLAKTGEDVGVYLDRGTREASIMLSTLIGMSSLVVSA